MLARAYSAEVVSVVAHGKYRVIELFCPAISNMSRPGQFLGFLIGSRSISRTWLSIANANIDLGTISVCVRYSAGPVKEIYSASTGHTFNVLGPLGNGFELTSISKLLLVAGAHGSAPLCFAASLAVKSGIKVRALLGGKSKEDLFSPPWLSQACEVTEFFTEDGTYGRHGLVTDGLLPFSSWADTVFVCGPNHLSRAVFNIVSQDHEEVSLFGCFEQAMACGWGACYSCVIPMWIPSDESKSQLVPLCTTGPVINLRQIDWERFS